MTTDTAMPVAFLGHGSPMNALEQNRYTDAWRAFGTSVPRPRAILVISAHWYINATAVTSMEWPDTIHDFFGFPEELFAMQYAAPGAPDVAAEVSEIVKPTWVGLDRDSWGLDHGTWSVLCHAFPAADVPVVQLSINATESFDYHLELGRKLAPLRNQGVLIIGSGNVVHNLRGIDRHQPDTGFDWAQRFDDHARETMLDAPGNLADIQDDRDFTLAVPTPDHFIPLLYLAGLADSAAAGTDVLIDGYTLGSLSMTAYTLGADSPAIAESPEGSASLPDDVAPENTNA
jgi:4,5-DOPA dioxygenase extradiol